ncbi:hypothetical protein JCM8547_006740 [Rhodosporidiobolus lusitaniae]
MLLALRHGPALFRLFPSLLRASSHYVSAEDIKTLTAWRLRRPERSLKLTAEPPQQRKGHWTCTMEIGGEPGEQVQPGKLVETVVVKGRSWRRLRRSAHEAVKPIRHTHKGSKKWK